MANLVGVLFPRLSFCFLDLPGKESVFHGRMRCDEYNDDHLRYFIFHTIEWGDESLIFDISHN